MTRSILDKPPLIIFLMGPTTTGKTTLAMNLHKHLPIDIISVDSILVYRGMDIGTAKPSTAELKLVHHYLINIRDPIEFYSIAHFLHDAIKIIEEIVRHNRIPLLVGGTMLYFKVLLEGLSVLPKPNFFIRTQIQDDAKKYGWQSLHARLYQIDPISASRIHPNDTQRIVRALEVYLISGSTLTKLMTISCKKLTNYKIYQFVIMPNDRLILHQRIKKRFYQMLDDGFKDEVITLLNRDDINRNIPSLQCIGYRQMCSHLYGDINYNNMVSSVINATKQLAKRQITWLKKWHNIHCLSSYELNTNINSILQVINLNTK